MFLTIIASISVYRLWKISRKNGRNPPQMYKIIYSVMFINLFIALAMPGSVLLWRSVNGDSSLDAQFVASSLSCISSNFNFPEQSQNNFVRKVTIYYVILVVGGSLVLTTIINVSIAFKVCVKGAKVGHGVPRRTLFALGSVAWLFIVSYLPVVVYSIWSTTHSQPPDILHTILNCSMGLNVCCNPIIYGISNKNFRGNVAHRFSVAVNPATRKKGTVAVPQSYEITTS